MRQTVHNYRKYYSDKLYINQLSLLTLYIYNMSSDLIQKIKASRAAAL